MSITNKGIIFSMDTLIAFTILLFILMVFVINVNSSTNNLTQNVGHFFLEEKTFLIADSLVKNYNEENNLLGACVYDPKKRRVKSNEINSQNFLNLKTINQDNFFVKSVSYTTNTRNKKVVLSEENGECIIVKRFVLIDGEKGVVFVEGCIK